MFRFVTIITLILICVMVTGCSKDPKVEWNELNNTAAELYAEGKYEAAIEAGKKATAVAEEAFGPTHLNVAKSLYNLGGYYYIQNRMHEAEPIFIRALKIKMGTFGPTHMEVADILNLLGNVYSMKGEDGKAESVYRDALSISIKLTGKKSPKVSTILGNLAAIYVAQGKLNKAARYYNTALQISPDSQSLLKNKAELEISQKNIKTLIAEYLDKLQQHPDDPKLTWKLGNLSDKNDKNATLYYRKTIEIKPDHFQAHLDLAAIYEKQKQYDDALLLVQKARDLNPNRVDIVYWTACLYAQKKDINTSIEWLKKALGKGYRNWEKITTDDRIAAVRETDAFKEILEQNKKAS